MAEICFVIMPYGGIFDEIYKRVYAPAIRAVGLEPLRADEIYDNQTISGDINQSIRTAKVLLADVTGRNPNVNYELGAAHALDKEVIILTSEKDDVPSDYRHIRFLYYQPGTMDWNQRLAADVEKTLRTVLARLEATGPARRRARIQGHLEALRQSASGLVLPVEEDAWEEDCNWREQAVIDRAKELGYSFQIDANMLSRGVVLYKGSHVKLECREGPVDEWEAAAACLICEKVRRFDQQLPDGHALRMRSVFYDLYGVHGFFLDYLYDRGELPLYTAGEILRAVEDEFDGQLFQGELRYLEENFGHDRFSLDGDQYYQESVLSGPRNAVCRRDGFYAADVDHTISRSGHSFYCLDGLLPVSELGGAKYVPQETHWLADWNHPEARFRAGETVRFQIRSLTRPEQRDHTPAARNISFKLKPEWA